MCMDLALVGAVAGLEAVDLADKLDDARRIGSLVDDLTRIDERLLGQTPNPG